MSDATQAAPELPDTVGPHERAAIVAEMYVSLCTQLARLDISQRINGEDDEALVMTAAGPMLDSSGAPLSYGRRRQQLREARQRAVEAAGDDWPLVERIVRGD